MNGRKFVNDTSDGCYLSHYAQWFFWFFFTIGIFVVAGGVGMMFALHYDK